MGSIFITVTVVFQFAYWTGFLVGRWFERRYQRKRFR